MSHFLTDGGEGLDEQPSGSVKQEITDMQTDFVDTNCTPEMRSNGTSGATSTAPLPVIAWHCPNCK
eukprot:3094567-Karenia_brevis.AAC.1